jgi:type I restriction enzyme S subunit
VAVKGVTLNKHKLERLRVELPPSVEQRRIAEILDSVDGSIHATDRLISKLKRSRRAFLFGLLPSEVISSVLSSDSAQGSEVSGWNVTCCAEICRAIVVGIVIKPAQYYVESGVPVLRSLNIREGRIDMSEVRYMTSASHHVLRKSAVSPGDVLTVRTGTPGKTAVVPDALPSANCVDIIISRPGRHIDSEYLALWMNSPFGSAQVLSRQGGLAQQHFNVTEMKKLRVAFPSRNEQRRIVAAYNCYSSKLAINQRLLAKQRSIKQGLVEDLLSGRVRVKARGV